MNRWELYHEQGLMPSTAPDTWLDYPWGRLGAYESMQDVDDFDTDVYCPHHKAGKWMLHFRLEELDDVWQDACGFFEEGKFQHVNHIKIGSFKPNERSPPGKRCLTLHCHTADPTLIIEAGLSIVKHMKYSVCCYYRTNAQSKECHFGYGRNFKYFIRPEMHNAEPSWILERFFPEI